MMAVLCLLSLSAFAQNSANIKGVLVDESTGEPIPFATVSLTRDGQTRPAKYSLTDDKGAFTLESVRNGSYTLVAELLGYNAHQAAVKVESKAIDLGKIQMKVDKEMLEAAEVSALGAQVIVKKDTIEYNANAFLSTDNDNLVDLLKKMPGIEVADNGTITVNGETVSRITIQGKTFFLDDPNMASQNIPAKLVKKLKVIRKKSEQAEFTGIDDGQEQTVIDLSLQDGAQMRGLVGRATAGVGHDIPSDTNPLNDYRYTGNVFLGRFSDKTQISLILNGNNANTATGGNIIGGMMGRGGGGFGGGGGAGMGGGGGLTTSYTAGLNVAGDAFDNRMEIGGNYNYGYTNNLSGQESSTLSYLTGYNQLVESSNTSTNTTNSHNFGFRMEHKFSDNTSILLEPNIRMGSGPQASTSESRTYRDNLDGVDIKDNLLNYATTDNSSMAKQVSASTRFLFRQRLGLPGRTLTANVNASLSSNNSDAINKNTTEYYQNGQITSVRNVNQNQLSDSKSYSVNSRLTYTEPLGNYFYLEADYSFNWSKSLSERNAYDLLNNRQIDYDYSNKTENLNRRHEIGGNVLYQDDRMHLQAGFFVMPNFTQNTTYVYDVNGNTTPKTYEDTRWNYSPQVMMMFDLTDNTNLRFNYRGQSSQPSTQQLMPVPDNTNPLRVSFGNPELTPYFTHNITANLRNNNRVRMSSFNLQLGGGFTQNQISNVVITNKNGGQYTIPMNAPTTGNANINLTNNNPIGKSAFSISNTIGTRWSQSFAYEGINVDMSAYNQENGFYKWMDWFVNQVKDPTYYKAHIVENYTDNLNVNERFQVSYRGLQLNVTLGASTNMSKSWYRQKGDAADQSTASGRNTETWNNTLSGSLTWNWILTGMDVRLDANYRWYNGYTTPVDPQCIINMSVSKAVGPVNLTLNVNDLLAQSVALSVTDGSSRHAETLNTTRLGRYIILSASFNFGNFGGRRTGGGRRGGGNRGGGGMMGGGMPGGGMMMGGGAGMMGGGRPPMM